MFIVLGCVGEFLGWLRRLSWEVLADALGDIWEVVGFFFNMGTPREQSPYKPCTDIQSLTNPYEKTKLFARGVLGLWCYRTRTKKFPP